VLSLSIFSDLFSALVRSLHRPLYSATLGNCAILGDGHVGHARKGRDPCKLDVERRVSAALLLTVPTEAVGGAGRWRAQSNSGGGWLVYTSTAAGIVAASGVSTALSNRSIFF
jgi:hypothetical protein